jgi:DNA repair protein RadC
MKEYKKRVCSFRIVKDYHPEIGTAKITKSANIAEYIRPFFGPEIEVFESMYLITLNQGNNIVSVTKISQGGISGTVVDIRLIAKYALDGLATSIILVHNHPGGGLTPSPKDKAITNTVEEAMKLLDITLLDHLIVTKDGHYSFADEGIM